ncbi:hypothetical protein SAMN05216360_109261 [Methylobacterium phyllostachyos]|uniref:Uncharacterized protein n=1 Tax=Methylobacterium phyllostachyos TaxID=582672 RepID=A0A1H0CRE0_9HYPH|nr:hypothetical protein SAMN05216360_109261 [Methylobacterium phyllostachyos]
MQGRRTLLGQLDAAQRYRVRAALSTDAGQRCRNLTLNQFQIRAYLAPLTRRTDRGRTSIAGQKALEGAARTAEYAKDAR